MVRDEELGRRCEGLMEGGVRCEGWREEGRCGVNARVEGIKDLMRYRDGTRTFYK